MPRTSSVRLAIYCYGVGKSGEKRESNMGTYKKNDN